MTQLVVYGATAVSFAGGVAVSLDACLNSGRMDCVVAGATTAASVAVPWAGSRYASTALNAAHAAPSSVESSWLIAAGSSSMGYVLGFPW